MRGRKSCKNNMTITPSRTLLRLHNISLNYGEFRALHQIDLELGVAEVHAIIGEHGAGKSSLGLLMNGILQPFGGTITFEGREYAALTVTNALKLGIRMIYQQVRLYEQFTVAENLFLSNNRINRFFWSTKKRFLNAANALLTRYQFDLDPKTLVQNLHVSDQTVVEILKHIHHRPKLLILDEALERLSTPALNKMLAILADLRRAGTSILVITHRIDDIYHLADRVSILKNGEILLTDEIKNIDKIHLIKMAYTQISAEENIENLNKEFYQLLKYNEAILRNLPVNLIVTDTENRIKMINDHCKRYFALQDRSYFNVPLAEIFSSLNPEVFDFLNKPMEGKEGKTFYQVPITFHANPLISNLKIFPIHDETFLIGKIIIIEDVTEYDQLQKQVMLSEKLASVGLLAAGVAHEINNPLGIVYNYLSHIKYNFQGKELHEAIDHVHEEISSIANIVSHLHTFSDKKQADNEELDVNEIIRRMLNLIKHHARRQQIEIHFTPSEAELFIRANRNEIKQVLLNLFKNSFEAMPSGGEIFINTGLLRDQGAKLVQIRFKDTGPGICDDNPMNIFLPFYSTKKGSEQNLGLGLSVSYGIIKKYHGTISVQNLDNSGCQFVISVPQCEK